MTYIPQDRFIQICCGARQYSNQGTNVTELFALDENGLVHEYNFEHKVWVPLERTRAVRTVDENNQVSWKADPPTDHLRKEKER